MVGSSPLPHTYAVVGQVSLVGAMAEYRQSIRAEMRILKAMQKQLNIL